MDIEPLDYLSDYSCYVLLSILFTITVIIMQMLLIIFSIIGFVELIYQHKHCLSEVPIICNLSILTIIVNLLHFFQIICIMNRAKEMDIDDH